MKVDLVGASAAKHVFDRESTLDLALSGLVRLTVDGRFRDRIVTPRPLDGWAVELLEIVGPAHELRREHDARGRDGDERLCAHGNARATGVLFLPALVTFL